MVPRENDIPDGIVSKVSELCLKEPSAQNTNEKPRYFEQYLKRFQSSNYTEEICIYVPNNGETPKIGFGLNTSEQSPLTISRGHFVTLCGIIELERGICLK